MSLSRVGVPLHSHHHEPWPMRIARRVVNLSVIHLEERGNELDEPVHQLLQFRRVTSECHGSEENQFIPPPKENRLAPRRARRPIEIT